MDERIILIASKIFLPKELWNKINLHLRYSNFQLKQILSDKLQENFAVHHFYRESVHEDRMDFWHTWCRSMIVRGQMKLSRLYSDPEEFVIDKLRMSYKLACKGTDCKCSRGRV